MKPLDELEKRLRDVSLIALTAEIATIHQTIIDQEGELHPTAKPSCVRIRATNSNWLADRFRQREIMLNELARRGPFSRSDEEVTIEIHSRPPHDGEAYDVAISREAVNRQPVTA